MELPINVLNGLEKKIKNKKAPKAKKTIFFLLTGIL